MPFKPTGASFSAEDLRKLQEDLKEFPIGGTRASISKALMKKWKKTYECMDRWVMVAQAFGPSVIDAFEAGKLNRERMYQIARYQLRMPSWKNFLAEKAIKEGLTARKLDQVKELIDRGKHPEEAVDIILGKRSEVPITQKETFSIESLIHDIEVTGLSWRKKWEHLRMLVRGKLQAIQNGKYKDRLVYDAVAMKVAADDVARFANELVGEIPSDIMEMIRAEIEGVPVHHEVKPEPEVHRLELKEGGPA